MPSTHPTVLWRPSLFQRTHSSITDLDAFVAKVKHSLWATWTYLFLLVSTFVILLLISAFSQQTSVHIIQLPSESTFDQLHQLHSLSCRCSRSSTPYRSFLNISTRYHQVCSSDFTSSTWWTLIASRGNEPFVLLDQPLLSNHFRMLSSFCALSSQTIQNAINAFMSSAFVTVEVLTRTQFNDQIGAVLKNLIEQIPINFRNPFTHIINTLRANQLTHLFLSNWMIAFSSATENYILSNKPLTYNNGTCTCATADGSSCWWPLTFLSDNQTNLTIPGLRGGCLPVDGLRQSTLECLYDERCLATIRSLINTTFTPSIPAPLDHKSTTRFPSHSTAVGAMIDQLFVEEWINASDYSSYYQQCAPHDCRYTSVEHETVLYMITSLLGLYGGVTLCLRMFVISAFKLLDWISIWHRTRNPTRIMPDDSTDTS